ncbi:hypothetical protein [Cribrihabitans pelagius]|uniref:hypothetical protein n=1 Tax=Cribrihabitans pelagius TaxID=1765746 RepID=UPI003B5AD3B0
MLLSPEGADRVQRQPRRFRFEIDGQAAATFAMTHDPRDAAMVAPVLLHSPLLARMAAGRRLTVLHWQGGRRDVSLHGAADALQALVSFCGRTDADLRPAINCATAQTLSAQAVCTHPGLAELDRSMAALLQRLGTGGAAGSGLAQGQAAWSARMAGCGSVPDCIAGHYRARLQQLEGVTAQTRPAAAPAARPGRTLDGREAVAQGLGLWLLGQRPGFVRTYRVSNALRRDDLPPGYPSVPEGARAGSPEDAAFLQAVSRLAVRVHPPQQVVLGIPVRLERPGTGQPPSLRLDPPMVNAGLESSDPAAVRTLHVAAGYGMGKVRLIEQAPLPLPVPPAVAMRLAGTGDTSRAAQAHREDRTYLRAKIALGESRVRLPAETQNVYGLTQNTISADIAMRVEEVALILQPRTEHRPRYGQPVPPAPPEQVLHVWRRGAGQQTPPAGPASFADYGLLPQGGRMLHPTSAAREHLGLPPDPGRRGPARAQAASLALRLAAVMQVGGERPLAPELALSLAFSVLKPLERDRVLPVGFRDSPEATGMSAPEWQRALRRASPAIARMVQAKAPALPVRMRGLGLLQLQTYDPASRGFAFRLDPQDLLWLQGGPANGGLWPYRNQFPEFLPVPESRAIALLQRLEVDRLPGESVVAVLDYQLGPPRVLARGQGPVTQKELDLLEIPVIPEALHLLENLEAQTVLASFPLTRPEPADGADLPAELYLTTAASLWAAAGALPGGEAMLAERAGGLPGMGRLTNAQRLMRIRQEITRISALRRESYIVGGVLRLAGYDTARGGFALQGHLRLEPVAHRHDLSELRPPALAAAAGEAMPFLAATPEQAQQIEVYLNRQREFRVLLRVRPLAVKEHSTLLVSRPSEILAGPARQNGFPERIALTLTVAAKKRTEASPDATLAAPERLYLDRETVDLLTIRAEPQLYDRDAFKRMLDERLARERLAAAQGAALPWGAFFRNPDAGLTEEDLAAVLPAFTEWTRKRAARLPERLIVPMAAQGMGDHPVTGCSGFGYLAEAGRGGAVSGHAGKLLGSDAQTVRTARPQSAPPQVPAPGLDRALLLRGRASHQGIPMGFRACPSMPRHSHLQTPSADGDAAAYTDALVILRKMPTPGAVAGRPVAYDYGIEVSGVRFVPLPPGGSDLPGFRGGIVLEGTVTELAVHTAAGSGQSKVTARLAPKDWQAAHGTAPASLEIRGLTLGMSEAEFLERARGIFPEGAAFRALPQAQPTLYGSAAALVSADGEEALAATLVPGADGALVTAILYHRRLPAGDATFAGLRSALERKYGAISVERSGREFYWGVPAAQIDPMGLCTGTQLFQGLGAPQMQLEGTGGSSAENPGGTPALLPRRWAQGGNWRAFGWPSDGKEARSYFRAEEVLPLCGPAVAARVGDRGREGLTLDIWLVDIPRARALAEAAPRVQEEIDLDL